METLIKFLGFIGMMILMAFIFSLPIMWLWNWLMPTLFGLVEINWLQALGISILTGFLFRTNNNW